MPHHPQNFQSNQLVENIIGINKSCTAYLFFLRKVDGGLQFQHHPHPTPYLSSLYLLCQTNLLHHNRPSLFFLQPTSCCCCLLLFGGYVFTIYSNLSHPPVSSLSYLPSVPSLSWYTTSTLSPQFTYGEGGSLYTGLEAGTELYFATRRLSIVTRRSWSSPRKEKNRKPPTGQYVVPCEQKIRVNPNGGETRRNLRGSQIPKAIRAGVKRN